MSVRPLTDEEGPVQLDALMFGEPERLSPYLLPGKEPALIDPGPATSFSQVIETLDMLGIESLSAIVLTHIHLDHAGGVGLLARRYPDCQVLIHERVAGLLSEPEPLVQSVESVWGDRTDALFGRPVPVAGDRVHPLSDGDRLTFGRFELEAVWTPGHTRAHMAFLEHTTGSLFCGDAIGVQLPGSPVLRPSTPPSDFSTETALASMERLAGLDAERVLLPHFGPARQRAGELLELARKTLLEWHEAFLRVREAADDELELERLMNAAVEGGLERVGPATRRGFEQVNPVWLNLAGLRDEAERMSSRS